MRLLQPTPRSLSLSLALVRPLASLRRHPIRRCDIDVHVVANVELGLEQGQRVVGVPLPRTGDADLAHPIAGIGGLDESEIKVGALAPCLRIHVTDQRGELLQSGILPGVDLEFVGRDVAVLVVGSGVMAPGGAEDAQEQRAGLTGREKFDYLRFHSPPAPQQSVLTRSLSTGFVIDAFSLFSTITMDSRPAILRSAGG